MRHFLIQFCVIFLLLTALRVDAAPAAEQSEFFEARVRPLLVEHCYKCHGPEKAKGELRLDTRQGVEKGGKTGPVVVAGHPEKSLLIEAVGYGNPDLQMPPKEQLTAAQVADLAAWIKAGAVDPRDGATAAVDEIAVARRRWPFTPVVMPALPVVKNEGWVANGIDRFVLAKSEEKGIAPCAAADKRTLIRRATFDLTGLPPTPGEVEAFLADASPGAFARVVDRLLASPAYGQRYARYWLDLVRYTDSFDARGTGGAMDCAEAWRYRDYVVNAFNEDLPYDRFVREQVAGDLMKGPGFGVQGSGNTNARGLNPLIATSVYAIGNWGGGGCG